MRTGRPAGSLQRPDKHQRPRRTSLCRSWGSCPRCLTKVRGPSRRNRAPSSHCGSAPHTFVTQAVPWPETGVTVHEELLSPEATQRTWAHTARVSASNSAPATRNQPRIGRSPVTATSVNPELAKSSYSSGSTRARSPPPPLAAIARLPFIRNASPPNLALSVTPATPTVRSRIRAVKSASQARRCYREPRSKIRRAGPAPTPRTRPPATSCRRVCGPGRPATARRARVA